LTILRFSNVYGSARDRPERVIPKFYQRAISGESLELYGGGQTLDFTFVDDVASVIKFVIELEASTQRQDFNIVTGTSTSIATLASMIKRLTGSESRLIPQAARGFDAFGFKSDPTKTRNLLGPRFQPKALENGLSLYVDRMMKTETVEEKLPL
jgi:nucleoside-diphosphate-sugar epimerase